MRASTTRSPSPLRLRDHFVASCFDSRVIKMTRQPRRPRLFPHCWFTLPSIQGQRVAAAILRAKADSFVAE